MIQMLTSNIEITEEDIGFVINHMVRCGNAYIINVTTIGEPFTGALTRTPGAENKKFLLFTCCEAQEQNAKNNIKHIVSICNEMINKNDAIFIASDLTESNPSKVEGISKDRILH